MSASVNLVDAYLQGIADLRAGVSGMTREQFAAKPVPGKMSTLEVLCHLADFDTILANRMKRVIAIDDKPMLLSADENCFLEKLHYADRDPEEELAVVEATRKQMARILRKLTPEQFQLQGTHSERGLLTLERILQLATNHVNHHLAFIHEKRKALGLS